MDKHAAPGVDLSDRTRDAVGVEGELPPVAGVGARRGKALINVLIAPVFFVAALVAWQVGVKMSDVPSYILPPPTDIASTVVADFGLLLREARITIVEVLLGFALGGTVAVASAVLVTLVLPLRRVFVPSLLALQAVPKVTLAPLVVVWFGFGLTSKVVLAAIFSFFPTFLNTLAGMDRVDPGYLDLASVHRATGWRRFAQIRFPAALPQMFDGLRIAVPMVVVGAIIAEFTGARAGLGHLIKIAAANLNTELVFAAIIATTVLSLSLYGALNLLASKLVPWSK